ncbi:hypothetical protein TNCV_3849481 [Trichonephila clavipes]|nr:hypothetical protein TNCV_3849481 [Trichonephila clavipes]
MRTIVGEKQLNSTTGEIQLNSAKVEKQLNSVPPATVESAIIIYSQIADSTVCSACTLYRRKTTQLNDRRTTQLINWRETTKLSSREKSTQLWATYAACDRRIGYYYLLTENTGSIPNTEVKHHRARAGIAVLINLIDGTIFMCDNTRLSFGARTAGVHYRLFSVQTLVPVRLGKQWFGNSTVDEIASEAADCRLTYTMANGPQWRLEKPKGGKRRKNEKERAKKRRGLVVLESGEENPRVLVCDADQESCMRIRKKHLADYTETSYRESYFKRSYHTD